MRPSEVWAARRLIRKRHDPPRMSTDELATVVGSLACLLASMTVQVANLVVSSGAGVRTKREAYEGLHENFRRVVDISRALGVPVGDGEGERP